MVTACEPGAIMVEISVVFHTVPSIVGYHQCGMAQMCVGWHIRTVPTYSTDSQTPMRRAPVDRNTGFPYPPPGIVFAYKH